MDESKKSFEYFTPFEQSVLTRGTLLDIGAGRDKVLPHAKAFDWEHGDANTISDHISELFTCVYSSHCLEHMRSPKEALSGWWNLVQPEGYLFFIVPDEDLYEQGLFPSCFNSDHKFTFTISKKRSWSPQSINVFDLVRALPNVEIVSMNLNDINYKRRYLQFSPGLARRTVRFGQIKLRHMHSRGLFFLPRWLDKSLSTFGVFDQTEQLALAQIEVILKKLPVSTSTS